MPVLPHRIKDLEEHRARLVLLAEKVCEFANSIDYITNSDDAARFTRDAAELRGLTAKLDLEAFRTFRLVERFWDEAADASKPQSEPKPRPVAKTIDDLI